MCEVKVGVRVRVSARVRARVGVRADNSNANSDKSTVMPKFYRSVRFRHKSGPLSWKLSLQGLYWVVFDFHVCQLIANNDCKLLKLRALAESCV